MSQAGTRWRWQWHCGYWPAWAPLLSGLGQTLPVPVSSWICIWGSSSLGTWPLQEDKVRLFPNFQPQTPLSLVNHDLFSKILFNAKDKNTHTNKKENKNKN